MAPVVIGGPQDERGLLVADADALVRLGVDVRTSSIVTAIDETGVTYRGSAADTGPAQSIAAQTVLWAAGVAASPLARSLGVPLDRAGRVTPEPTLALAAHPEIFVTGDICS